ncbi:hypothetical protein [Methanimicrococcus hacksteinii]|uniref:hypothetical protein n=1 Tax=Methanimicrococcus hacksteinii TaxID=3028293 RepID=UPI00298F14DF|nr:hypothetical protein [Methanimicrococcus sp. At1]
MKNAKFNPAFDKRMKMTQLARGGHSNAVSSKRSNRRCSGKSIRLPPVREANGCSKKKREAANKNNSKQKQQQTKTIANKNNSNKNSSICKAKYESKICQTQNNHRF